MISNNTFTSSHNFVNLCEVLSYENPFFPTKHNYHVISAQFLREGEASNEIILDKIESIFKNAIKPLAIIVSASYDPNHVFDENKGYFKWNRQELLIHGYEVIQIKNVDDPNEIGKILQSVPEKNLDFFHLRGHGRPNDIAFSQEIYLKAQDVLNTFNWLPKKLNPKATVFLESCDTGNVEQKNFHNNVQFSFGKLTKDLPDIKIVAPSKSCYFERFTISCGQFKFYARSDYDPSNMIKIIDSETKKLLQDSKNELDLNEAQSLLATLKMGDGCPTGYTFYTKNYLDDNSLVTGKALLLAIMKGDLEAVQQILIAFHLDPNNSGNDNCLENYFPLCMAIKHEHKEIIEFLLERGADIFIEHAGMSPLNFLFDTLFNTSKCTSIMPIFDKHMLKLDKLHNTHSFSEKFDKAKTTYKNQRNGIYPG